MQIMQIILMIKMPTNRMLSAMKYLLLKSLFEGVCYLLLII